MNRQVRLGKTATRVLFLVLNGKDRGHPYSIKEIAQMLGNKNHNWAYDCIRRLRRLGLVSESGVLDSGARSRTIVPLCRFIPAEELLHGTKE